MWLTMLDEHRSRLHFATRRIPPWHSQADTASNMCNFWKFLARVSMCRNTMESPALPTTHAAPVSPSEYASEDQAFLFGFPPECAQSSPAPRAPTPADAPNAEAATARGAHRGAAPSASPLASARPLPPTWPPRAAATLWQQAWRRRRRAKGGASGRSHAETHPLCRYPLRGASASPEIGPNLGQNPGRCWQIREINLPWGPSRTNCRPARSRPKAPKFRRGRA